MLVVPSFYTGLAVQGRRDPWERTFLVQNRKERGRCRVAPSLCAQMVHMEGTTQKLFPKAKQEGARRWSFVPSIVGQPCEEGATWDVPSFLIDVVFSKEGATRECSCQIQNRKERSSSTGRSFLFHHAQFVPRRKVRPGAHSLYEAFRQGRCYQEHLPEAE
ncbi:hypothetical protein BJX65DRAFT_272184 [Aspergillus insuetus]